MALATRYEVVLQKRSKLHRMASAILYWELRLLTKDDAASVKVLENRRYEVHYRLGYVDEHLARDCYERAASILNRIEPIL
jgi:hypothetical protein